MSPLLSPCREMTPSPAGWRRYAAGIWASWRRVNFLDGETYLRFTDDLTDRNLVLVCTLAQPNPKIMPLVFAASAARELGARKVGLVAPYLCYMRQDRRFNPGEAVTSRSFAALLSRQFDWLATVDPHLHRFKSLGELYSIPARALHAGPAIAAWIKVNVENPFLIGPDAESEQWVSAVARDCGADFSVLHKDRLGDREVRTAGHLVLPAGATPVLVDDILSSGQTMLEALRLVRPMTEMTPVVIAVHGLFAPGALEALRTMGARLVATNSVRNPVETIDIAALIASAIGDLAA